MNTTKLLKLSWITKITSLIALSERDGDKGLARMCSSLYPIEAFERAIHALAPACSHCGCKIKIVGHGVEIEDSFYCCAHCADNAGKSGLRDRA